MFLYKKFISKLITKTKSKHNRFIKIEFDFFSSYDLTQDMGIFKNNQEVVYRSDFDKKNRADIRTLVLEKNARDEYDKKIQNRIVVALSFCLIIGLALVLIK